MSFRQDVLIFLTSFDDLCQEIGPATQNALDKLSEILYRKSLYKADFQPFGPGKKTSLNLPGIGNQETSVQRRLRVLTKVSEATGRKEVTADMGNGRKVGKCGNMETGTGMTEDKDEDEEEEEEEENVLDWDWSNTNDQSNESEVKKTRATWLYEKRNASTVLPTRSPYPKPQGNQTGFSTSITLPQCLQNSSFGSSTKAASLSEILAQSKAIRKIALAKPTLDDAGSVTRHPSVPGRLWHATGVEGMSQDIRLPSLGAMICDLPQYRDGTLHHQRRRKLPLMVGMRFKSDAHAK